MSQSGNLPPRRGQSPKGGNAPLNDDRPLAEDGENEVAAEGARERLAKRGEAEAWDAGSTRVGELPSRRGPAKNAPKRSTAVTAGAFGTVLVVLAVLVIVLVSITGRKTPTTVSSGNGLGMRPAPASVVNAITHLSSSAFAEAGSTITSSGPYTASITALKNQPPLTRDGKPLIAYVGSNFCPYCAASRWPLAVALARFGSFKNLHITASGAAPEFYPGTPTLSFYGSTYTSAYITFLPTEQCTDVPSSGTSAAVEDCNGYKPLQSLSPLAHKIFLKYDFPPYASSTYESGIPFVDFGNKFIEDGAFMDPSVLAGFTHVQVARSLGNPAASPAQPILVSANFYTAAICKLTNNKPDSVCKMPVVKRAAKQLQL